MLEQEIAEFGRRMGIPSLTLGNDNLVALDVEHMGRLHLEKAAGPRQDTELLIYLSIPCPAYDRDAPARVLDLCHYRYGHPLPLTGGVHAGRYILLTRLSEREATAAALENTAQFLARMMQKVAN